LAKAIFTFFKVLVLSQNSHEENEDSYTFLGGNILCPGRDLV